MPKGDSSRKRSDCRRQASALDSPSGSLGASITPSYPAFRATLETIIKDEARRGEAKRRSKRNLGTEALLKGRSELNAFRIREMREIPGQTGSRMHGLFWVVLYSTL